MKFASLLLKFYFATLFNYAFAQIISARPHNYELREQLEVDSNRVLNVSDSYSLAVDGRLFRNFRGDEYYHGGYWVDAFAELRQIDPIRLNIRGMFYNPAASYGYSATSYFHALLGVSYIDRIGDFNLRGIFFDLDRQTLGAGLTLEDKEMSGLIAEISNDTFGFKYLVNGTGGYDHSGDIWYYEAFLFNRVLGLSTFKTNLRGKPFFNVFSIVPVGSYLEIAAEGSQRNLSYAGMASATVKSVSEMYTLKLKYQYRRYQESYADEIVSKIDYDSVSYEQRDYPVTNSMNIFSIDDNVTVNSIIFNGQAKLFKYENGARWIGLTENELYRFDYREREIKQGYFYKHSIGLCPIKYRDDCLMIYATNKSVHQKTPTIVNDLGNRFLFEKAYYLGAEARFRM